MKPQLLTARRLSPRGPVRVVYFTSSENERELIGVAVRHRRASAWRVLSVDMVALASLPYLRNVRGALLERCRRCDDCGRPRDEREARRCIGCARDVALADAPGY